MYPKTKEIQRTQITGLRPIFSLQKIMIFFIINIYVPTRRRASREYEPLVDKRDMYSVKRDNSPVIYPSIGDTDMNKGYAYGNKPSMSHDMYNPILTGPEPNISPDFATSMVKHLRMPISEVKRFGGNCMEYKKFIRQFHSKVIQNTDNDDERMNFLEQYTIGEANKLV